MSNAKPTAGDLRKAMKRRLSQAKGKNGLGRLFKGEYYLLNKEQ